MYHFIYKTTNQIDGKVYVGLHSTGSLDDKYLGSGVYLKRAIKKYGVQNFTREILEFCEDRDSLLECEIKWIRILDCLVPNGYNLREDVGQAAGMLGKTFKLSDEAKKKISDGNKGKKRTQRFKDRLRTVNTGKKLSDEHKEKIKVTIHKIDYKHTEETKQLISEVQKNRARKPLSQEHRTKIGESLKGTVFTQERRNNISKAKKGKVVISEEQRRITSEKLKGRPAKKVICPYCEKIGGVGGMAVHIRNCKENQ